MNRHKLSMWLYAFTVGYIFFIYVYNRSTNNFEVHLEDPID